MSIVKGSNKDVPSDSSAIRTNQILGSNFEKFQKKYDDVMAYPIIGGPIEQEGAKYAYLKDTPLKEKKAYAAAESLGDPQVTVPLTDEDVKVAKERQKVLEQYNFDHWLHGKFGADEYGNIQNQAVREWLQQVYPQYFEARQKVIEEEEHLRSRLRSIDLHGPKDLEDLWILWRAENDHLRERIGLADYLGGAPDENHKFRRGFFNASKWTRADRAISHIKADPFGLAQAKSGGGQSGGGQSGGGQSGGGQSGGGASPRKPINVQRRK